LLIKANLFLDLHSSNKNTSNTKSQIYSSSRKALDVKNTELEKEKTNSPPKNALTTNKCQAVTSERDAVPAKTFDKTSGSRKEENMVQSKNKTKFEKETTKSSILAKKPAKKKK